MDLRQAAYVVAVVDHGTFTAAAASIPVSQPALSQAIAALERELGTELFHRLGREVQLTAAGEAFVEPARRMLRDAQVAQAAQDDHDQQRARQVPAQQFRIHETVLGGEQEAGVSGDRTRQRERGQLVRVGREARGPHALLVGLDAGQRAAEA